MKRNPKHRAACYPLAIPFRPARGTKIHTIWLKSRLPFSGKLIFRYVIFDV